MKNGIPSNEWLFPTVLDNLPEGVIVANKDGLVAYMNPAAQRMTEWNLADALATPVGEIVRISGEGTENTGESSGRLSLKNQGQLSTKSGKKVYVEYTTSFIRNEKQGVFAQVFSFHDASQYAEALENLGQSRIKYKHLVDSVERKLIEAEAKYRNLVERIPGIVYVTEFGPAGRWLYVSPQVQTILGFDPTEWLSANGIWLNHIHEEDREEVLREEAESLESRKPFVSEYRMLRRDGRTAWIHDEAIVIENSAGMPVALQGVMIDVTKQKQAEESQRSSQNRLAGILDIAEDAIISVDDDQHITLFNKGAEKTFGYRSSEILGKSLDILIPQRFAGIHRRHIQGFASSTGMARRMNEGGAIWGLRKDGTEFPAEASISKLQVGSEKILTVILRDVTERKEAEETKAQLEQQLRQSQKMEAIGRLAGGVAHDFNNMLMAISGYCDLLLMKVPPADQKVRDIHEIRKAVEQGAALTRQLLAFSRKQVLEARILDLNNILTDMENMLRRFIREDIHFEMRLEPELGRIKGDAGQFQQVVLNLTVNAIDAMPQGGRLCVETSNTELHEEYAGQMPGIVPGHYVMLAISDTGIGMNEETRSHIFEPFFTTKELGKGTGLGLSTVYGIIKQSEGHISVYTEPGKGSTFKIYLPRIDKPTEDVAPATLPTYLTSGSETIIVVDDNDSVRSAVARVLMTLGYRVLAANNGEEALQVSRNHEGTVHLVITDLVMPRMGGLELAQRLRAERPQTHFLFMSGYPEDAAKSQDALLSGAAFLVKPASTEAIARKVRELLESG